MGGAGPLWGPSPHTPLLHKSAGCASALMLKQWLLVNHGKLKSLSAARFYTPPYLMMALEPLVLKPGVLGAEPLVIGPKGRIYSNLSKMLAPKGLIGGVWGPLKAPRGALYTRTTSTFRYRYAANPIQHTQICPKSLLQRAPGTQIRTNMLQIH